MKIAIICGSIALGLFLLFFLAVFLLYRFIFYSPRKGQLNDFNLQDSQNYRGYEERIKKLITDLMNRPCEDIYIQSFDKLKLHARLFENKSSNKVAIFCHGYRGTAYRDFCGGATEMLELGYNVILIDQRAHGLSEGHSITFGVRETKDLLSWIEFAKQRFGQDMSLVLVGVSMGGHVVLSVADKVDKNVKIIADCPYSSPKAILQNSIKSIHLPIWLFYFLINISAKMFVHENMSKTSVYETISNSDNKILIIHGDKDSVVPYTNSLAVVETFPSKIQYELFPGADHGVSCVVDTKRYKEIVKRFLS